MGTDDTGGSPRAPRMPRKRVRTPTVLQMEAVECGAASLAIILAHYGRNVPLEELRVECGVSRDGSKASSIVKAARRYGLESQGWRKQPEDLFAMGLPLIVFWRFTHFLVVEGFGRGWVYLNDPAEGPRRVRWEEFDESFTGVALTFKPTEEFEPGGGATSLWQMVRGSIARVKLGLTLVLLCSLLLVVPGLVVPTLARVFVDEVLVRGASDWAAPLLGGFVLALIVSALLVWTRGLYLVRLEGKMALVASSRLFWHMLRLPMRFYWQRASQQMAYRTSLSNAVAERLAGRLAGAAFNVVSMVFFAAIMVHYDAFLTLVALLAVMVNVAVLKLVMRRREDACRKLKLDTEKLMGVSMGGLQIIETLKAGGRESDFFGRWAGHHASVFNSEQRLGQSVHLMGVVPPLLASLTFAVILGGGALRIMAGEMSVGMLVAFQVLTAALMGPVSQMVMLGGELQDIKTDLLRLDDVLAHPLDEPFTRAEAPQEGCGEAGEPKLRGAVELRDVSFGYSPLTPPLVQGLSLKLDPGMRVALVGASGSGKSTVSRLVAGLFQPWSGEILFDGKPRAEVPLAVLQNSVAMVDQSIILFEGTVRENIAMWDNTMPEEQVVRAAKDAAIHDAVTARPASYASQVAEAGANFSGGERQRLEIARALAGDPSILVLDEATSALDPVVEEYVDDRLRRRGCTCIIVAHRLSTIRDADEIIVLDKGKVVQRGTHELMRDQDGPYAQLVKTM